MQLYAIDIIKIKLWYAYLDTEKCSTKEHSYSAAAVCNNTEGTDGPLSEM